jgi:hypothetical protein
MAVRSDADIAGLDDAAVDTDDGAIVVTDDEVALADDSAGSVDDSDESRDGGSTAGATAVEKPADAFGLSRGADTSGVPHDAMATAIATAITAVVPAIDRDVTLRLLSISTGVSGPSRS